MATRMLKRCTLHKTKFDFEITDSILFYSNDEII